MAYPARAAWLFRNVTRAFDFWPTLESVLISEAAPLDLATLTCSVVDTAGTMVFDNEDEVRALFDGVRIFAGHVKTCEEDQVAETGPRRYNLDAQDYTAKLDDSVIDSPGDRAAETLAARVAWILSFLNYPITATSLALPSESCEAIDFDGMTVREALQTECDEHRLSMYVDFDKALHLFRTEDVSAPFDLNDVAPDYVTSFPYREYRRTKDSVDLATAAYVQGEKDQTWVTDAPGIAAYGRQERAVNDSELRTAAARTYAGTRALAEQSTPVIDGHLVCYQPGLRGGMTARIVNELWAVDADYVLTGVDISAVDPHDADGTAYLRSEVAFATRRKARGSVKDTVNKVTRRRHRPHTPPPEGPPAAEIVDDVTLLLDCWRLECENLTGDCDFDAVVGFTALWIGSSQEFLVPYTDPTCDSGISPWGCYEGRHIREAWLHFTLTVQDTDVGLMLTVPPIEQDIGGVYPHAFGEANPHIGSAAMWVGLGYDPPSGPRQYVPIKRVHLARGAEVFIPRTFLQDGDMYIALAPGWPIPPDGEPLIGYELATPANGPAGTPASEGENVSGNAMVVKEAYYVSDHYILRTVRLTGIGETPWVPGVGVVDGENRQFYLISWTGQGVVQARVGVAVLTAGEYSVNSSTHVVTIHRPPAVTDPPTIPMFRYQHDPSAP